MLTLFIPFDKLMLWVLYVLIIAIFYPVNFHDFVFVSKSHVLNFAIDETFQIYFCRPYNLFITVLF